MKSNQDQAYLAWLVEGNASEAAEPTQIPPSEG
jgi:hypothetical protein